MLAAVCMKPADTGSQNFALSDVGFQLSVDTASSPALRTAEGRLRVAAAFRLPEDISRGTP